MLITTALALVVRVTTAVLDFVIDMLCVYCGTEIDPVDGVYPDPEGPVHPHCAWEGGYDLGAFPELAEDPDDFYDRVMDR